VSTSWEPMLAKPAAALPAASALSGGTVYEPKWDGYRALVERTPHRCRLFGAYGTTTDDASPTEAVGETDIQVGFFISSFKRDQYATASPRRRLASWRPAPRRATEGGWHVERMQGAPSVRALDSPRCPGSRTPGHRHVHSNSNGSRSETERA
jgi:hypothetical protein